jgi:hypothetical protein
VFRRNQKWPVEARKKASGGARKARSGEGGTDSPFPPRAHTRSTCLDHMCRQITAAQACADAPKRQKARRTGQRPPTEKTQQRGNCKRSRRHNTCTESTANGTIGKSTKYPVGRCPLCARSLFPSCAVMPRSARVFSSAQGLFRRTVPPEPEGKTHTRTLTGTAAGNENTRGRAGAVMPSLVRVVTVCHGCPLFCRCHLPSALEPPWRRQWPSPFASTQQQHTAPRVGSRKRLSDRSCTKRNRVCYLDSCVG